jgi:hypothetical protein
MKRDNPQTLIYLDNQSGEIIGRDPRQVSGAELTDAGHEKDSLLTIMRKKCIDCCAGQIGEVRTCPATACDLWPYRMGTNPFAKRELTEEQKKAAAQRMAEARAKRSVAA